MNIKIIFYILTLVNVGLTNANSQNNISSQKYPTSQQISNSKVEKSKEQIEYEEKFKRLTPAQKSKFDEINRGYFKKTMYAVKSLNNEVSRISEIDMPLAIIDKIFPSMIQKNTDATQNNEISNKIYSKYLKLSSHKKKLIKIEFIKYRMIINKNETERASKMKEIFKKNYSIFRQFEDLKTIMEDEKTIDSD